MPTVTGPDGKQYHVNAPPGATDAQIIAYVQRMVAANHKATDPTTAEQLHGAASSFLDGVIPGAGGVVSGLAGAAMHPTEMAKGFTDARRASERHEERFKEDHPYLGAAATGAGFVGGMFLPVTKLGLAAKGAEAAYDAARAVHGAEGALAATKGARAAVPLGRRVLNSAINGGIMGAAGGAMDSHADSVGGFLQDTARGGLVGASVAGALPVAGRFVAPLVSAPAQAAARRLAPAVAKAGQMIPGNVGRSIVSHAGNMALDPAETRAHRYIGNKLADAGMSDEALMAELQRRHGLGVPAAPADVHEGLRDAYGSAARRPGPATAAVRKAIDNRQRDMTARVQDHIGASLGDVTNVEAQAAALKASGKEAAAPLYDISDAQHIPFVRELQELFQRPSAVDALQIAGRQLKDKGLSLSKHGLIEGKDGIFRLGRAPTMAMYDRAKTVLDNTIYAGSKPLVSPEVTRASEGAMDIRNRLLDIMDGDGTGPRIPHPNDPGTGLGPVGPTAPAPQPGPVHTPPQPALPGQAALPAPPPRPQTPPAQLPQHAPDPTLADLGLHPPQEAPQNAVVPYQAPGLPGGPGASPPALYEAPGGLGGHGADVPAIPHPNDPQEGFDYGQRLEPEAPPEPEAPKAKRTRRMSSIPPEGLNPYWKPARDVYARSVKNKEALELGQDMAKANATDAGNRMANMTSDSQRDFFRLGHRTGLADDVSALGDYGNAARRVDGSDKARKAIATVHGDDAAQALADRLQAEHEGYQTWAAVRGNSMTSGRQAADQIAEQEQALADTGRGLWAAAQGRGIDALRHFSSSFSGEPALTNKVNDITASKLGSTSLDDVAQTLGKVGKVREADKAIAKTADKVQKGVAKMAGTRAGAAVSTPDNQVLLGYGPNDDGTYYPVYGAPGTALGKDYIPAGL